MAQISFSGIGVTQARGRAGDLIYSRNQHGAYMKAYSVPGNPDTAYQQATRATFADGVTAWANLTSAEQEEWNSAAALPGWSVKNRLGQTTQLAGRSLFIKMFTALDPFGITVTTPPPKRSIIFPALTAVTYTNIAATITFDLTFSESSMSSNTVVQVWGTDTISPGITRPKLSLFKRFMTKSAASFTGSFSIKADWESRFGTFDPGTKIFIRCTVLDLTNAMQFQLGGGFVDVT